MASAQGERMPGGFILITGIDGTRWAVRRQSVAIVHDADECRDETLIQLHGGHVVRCRARLMKCSRGSREKRIMVVAYAPISINELLREHGNILND
jgi:hypothetical protein